MPTGNVTNIGKTQKGKWVITINGTDKYYPGNTDIASLRVGDKIIFESSEFAPGAYGMNDWKLVEGAAKYEPSVTQAPNSGITSNSYPLQTPSPNLGVPANRMGAPVQDSERPAISNWIAAAIAAGKIESCVDILPWVRAAKQALREDEEFQSDRDIPQ
jgi:hypothetical protein